MVFANPGLQPRKSSGNDHHPYPLLNSTKIHATSAPIRPTTPSLKIQERETIRLFNT